MKQITKFTFIVFCCMSLLGVMNATAQENPCGTTEMHLKQMESDPVYKKNYLAEQARLQAIDKREFATGYSASKSRSFEGPPKYIIPVVFHVIHQYGEENISDEQIKDGIRTLNEDFRKRNADTSKTWPTFKPISADCEIEFRLAGLDPNGKPTNGIERIESRLTNSGTDSAKLNPWPRANYLNIWVVKYVRDGFAAFATYPGGSAEKDGVLSLYTYIGAIETSNLLQSHTLSHEVAHFLNIQHVWGNTNAPEKNCGDDMVSDTPETKGHNNKCPFDSVCTPGVLENVQNFMEYSYCYTMFTEGQKTRMHAALNSSLSDRNNLWTANNLLVTGVTSVPQLTKANFKSSSKANSVCQGNALTFTDVSWNGHPTSWSWAFEGGTPATSTDSMPVVVYNTPGLYDVQLTVSNATGTVSETKKQFVTVNPTTGLGGNAYYRESFEKDTLPNPDWKVTFNAPGNTWQRTDLAASDGTHSAMIVNTTNSDTYYDDLIGPAIDMTKITGPSLVFAFKTAYAKRTSTSDDKIEVWFSANCGATWENRKFINSTKLSNGVIETGNFIPNSSQWILQTVNITGLYAASKNLLYKIRFTSNNGNNIYVDDIIITGSLGVTEEWMSKLNLNVYPNPMEKNAVVAFDLEHKEHITIIVRDVLGKTIATVADANLNPGHHEYAISENSELATGVYFVNFSTGNHSVAKKLIVNE